MAKIVLKTFFGRSWTKEDLELLALAIERGQDDIADITNHEYDILESAIRRLRNMAKQ